MLGSIGSAMGWFQRMLHLMGPATPPAADVRVSGRPTSSNRASSFHLEWLWAPRPPDLVEVGATLTVLERPTVPDLHFWALQASFTSEALPGVVQRHGGAHAGLQHHPAYPGGTAVNWGGYGADGRELDGTASALPSALGNANTRDLSWEAGRPHRLAIHAGAVGWVATVDDVAIRELRVGGDRLTGIMVWSEVFAPCDAPSSAVRWSDLWGRSASGALVAPVAVRTRYQSVADGGCSNTSSDPDPHVAGAVLQRTSVHRITPRGTRIAL